MAGIPVQLSKGALRRGRHGRHAFASIPRNPIYIAMDGLTCSHNVGCIFRMADAGDIELSTAASVVLFDAMEKLNGNIRR